LIYTQQLKVAFSNQSTLVASSTVALLCNQSASWSIVDIAHVTGTKPLQ